MDPEQFTSLRVAAICGQPPRAAEQVTGSVHPVSIVVLDLCGLLYDDSSWKRWIFKLLTHMGLHAHYGPLFRLWERDYQEAVWQKQRTFDDALADFLRSLGLSSAQV